MLPSVIQPTMLNDPFYGLFLLIGVALIPILAIMTTSFTKIIVVLSITRQAIGTAQTPPNMVIISLALLFTCFSMYPVGNQIFENLEHLDLTTEKSAVALEKIFTAAKEPMRNFLITHAKPEDKQLFFSLMPKSVSDTDFIILAPAFMISELSLAFQIGFLIYLPFLVIDMTVANLLMALGMQMLSPTTISLPCKILLFVLVDGWRMIAEGLSQV